MMKITKEQLKQIIKEELEATLGEQQSEDNFEESMYGKVDAKTKFMKNPTANKVYLHDGEMGLGVASVSEENGKYTAKLDDGRTFAINPTNAKMGKSSGMYASGKYARIDVNAN